MFNRSGRLSSMVNETADNSTFGNGRPTEWKVKLGFNVLFLVVGLLSNLFVILLNAKIKKARGKAPAYEYLISNLCVSDIAFVSMAFIDVYYKIAWSLAYCKLVPPFLTITMIVSMYTVAAIAVFRCRAIVNPFKAKPSQKCIYLTIAGLWLFALIDVVPYAIVLDVANGTEECAELWSTQTLNQLYTIALFLVQYPLPLTIMAVSYIRIVSFLKRNAIPRTGLTTDTSTQAANRRKRDMEVVKISIIIVMLYAILTLPLQIAWIAHIFDQPALYAIVSQFSDQLLLLHSCCNPFVYGTIAREFRSQAINVMGKVFGKFKRNNAPAEPVVQYQNGSANIALQEERELAIIPRNRVVHELIADEARSAETAISHVRRD